jgi:anti-sigma B factor antagonist
VSAVPAFEVQVASVDGAAVTVRIVGELDVVTAPGLEQRLGELCDEGARCLTVDLSSLAFIDSSGLSALVTTLKRYRAEGGDVVLRSPTRPTAKVLEISGLDQVFTIEDNGHSGKDPSSASDG